MADKKLLEETIIARFQQLANINGGSKAKVLSEGTDHGQRSATPTRGVKGTMTTAGQTGPVREEMKEEAVEEAMYDEADSMEDEAAADDMAGDDMGAPMEGGDLESAVSSLVDALNGVLAAAGMDDKQVELDSGSEGGEGEEAAPEMDMGGEEDEGTMAEAEEQEEGYGMKKEVKKPAKKEEEEEEEEGLEESIELVDDALIEKLVQRVSARLVAEARKAKALEEGKKSGKAGNWLAKPSHAKPPKAKGNPVKGGTPFKGGKKK